QNTCFIACGTNQTHAWQSLQLLGGQLQQAMLVSRNRIKAYRLYVTNGGIQRDHASYIRGTSLETLRYISIGTALETDGVDHVATTLPWRHVLEQIVACVQGAHAGRTVQLMPRKHIEITIYVLHIY